MAEYHVEILPSAWQDLDRIAEYHLRMVGAASAEKITSRILDVLEKLEAFPLMGALHPDACLARMEYRKVLCGDYVCVYRLIGQTVFVYRIVHGATDYPKLFMEKPMQ